MHRKSEQTFLYKSYNQSLSLVLYPSLLFPLVMNYLLALISASKDASSDYMAYMNIIRTFPLLYVLIFTSLAKVGRPWAENNFITQTDTQTLRLFIGRYDERLIVFAEEL